jgi:hypothetical protein
LPVSQGRAAALPPQDYEPPARLLTDYGQCTVLFVPEAGGEEMRFDFSQLPLPAPFCLALARAFAQHTGPAGRIKASRAARKTWQIIRRFCLFLAAQEQPPRTPAELRPRHLSEFLISGEKRATAAMDLGVVRSFLPTVEGLPPDVLAKCAEWVPHRRDTIFARSSYTAAEEKAILDAARNVVRLAARRIRSSQRLINQWRGGGATGVDGDADEDYCRLLDIIDRTGDVPREETPDGPRPAPWVRRYGMVDELCRKVFLSWTEASALLLLLVRLTGENGSTIARMPAAHHRPDSKVGPVPTAQVDLDKPRRGSRRYMTTTFADLPAWTYPAGEATNVSARDELHTPFGAYMLAIELTEPARRITGRPELLQYWRPKSRVQGRGFAVANEQRVSEWGRTLGLTPDGPVRAGGQEGGGRLEVGVGRMRATFLARERRPTAHTEQTLLDSYLRRDPTTRSEYQTVVADVLAAEVAKARRVGSMPRLTQDDLAQATSDPRAVAVRLGVTIETLATLVAREADTVLAGCSDNTHSSFTQHGQPCQASFLKCLECPCARALPHHLPVQVVAHDALAAARETMPALRWAQRFALPYTRLADLLEQVGEAAVARARGTATEDDRNLVRRLLSRELDQP